MALVGQDGDVGEVDAGDRQGRTPIEGGEGSGDHAADGGEEDGGVERRRRVVLEPTGPLGAQLQCQSLGSGSAGHHVHGGALGLGDLGRQVGGGAEPVDAETTTGWQLGALQRPIADDPRAQQRSRLLVREGVRQSVRVPLVDHRGLRVASVGIPTREARAHAQVLVAPQAESTATVGMPEPSDARPVPDGEPLGAAPHGVNPADDLVTGHHPRVVGREVALGQMEVGAAHPAHGDPHPNLARAWFGHVAVDESQRPARDGSRALDDPRPHWSATLTPRSLIPDTMAPW